LLEQVQAGAPPASDQISDDPEVRLAGLTLVQAQDDLAAAQSRVQAAAGSEPATFAVRAAERKLAEANLKLQQARASEDSGRASGDLGQGLADLRVAAARGALRAAEARFNEAQSGIVSPEAVRNEEQRAALLWSEALTARSQAQPVITLTAPFDGTVASVDVTQNLSIEPRTTVVRLDDPRQLSILASVSQWEVSRLTPDQPVVIDFPGVTGEAIRGTITDVSTAAVRESDRTGLVVRESDRIGFPVRIEVDRMPGAVRVGMIATVNANAKVENALYVPTTAVRTVGGTPTVTRVRADGSREDVAVAVGVTFGTNVVIVSGLRDQDVVAARAPAAGAGVVPTGNGRSRPDTLEPVPTGTNPGGTRQRQ
jgi:multidrug resistance efflux pump